MPNAYHDDEQEQLVKDQARRHLIGISPGHSQFKFATNLKDS